MHMMLAVWQMSVSKHAGIQAFGFWVSILFEVRKSNVLLVDNDINVKKMCWFLIFSQCLRGKVMRYLIGQTSKGVNNVNM